jgi:DNA-binding transcriptional MerR regulator
LPYWNAQTPTETSRLLTLSEASELFGVPYRAIYALGSAGLIDVLQRDGKGRKYYSEAQLRRAITSQYHLVEAA